MKPRDFLHQMNGATNRLIEQQEKEIKKVVQLLLLAKEKGKKVFICGNGGSAGTATHMMADLFKIGKLKAIFLNDNVPLLTALINDDGWGKVFINQLERLAEAGDILICISVHGGVGEEKAGPWSQNLNEAIKYSKKIGVVTIGFSGFDGGWMKDNCDVCVTIPADSTPIVEALHVVLHHYIAFELQEDEPCKRK